MRDLLQRLPLHVALADVLLTAISAVAHFDPRSADQSVDADRARAIRLIGRVPLIVADRLAATTGFEPVDSDVERSFPSQLAAMLTGTVPSPLFERALDVLLISVIDVGFSPAVQAARLSAATGADLHSAVLAAAAV